MHQKQAIAYSLEQAATVWGLGGQPASYSGKEYSRPGGVTTSPKPIVSKD
ncbi:hypothetical protein Q5692_39140 [Microcoleus sp. C2C3]